MWQSAQAGLKVPQQTKFAHRRAWLACPSLTQNLIARARLLANLTSASQDRYATFLFYIKAPDQGGETAFALADPSGLPANQDFNSAGPDAPRDLRAFHSMMLPQGPNGGAAADSGSGKRVEHIGKADNKRHANSDYYKDWCERDTVLKVAPNAGDAVRVRCTPRRLICAARALALVTHVTDTEAFAHVYYVALLSQLRAAPVPRLARAAWRLPREERREAHRCVAVGAHACSAVRDASFLCACCT